ncbi:flagellar hook-associated protein FlgK [Rhizobium cremeum]|uniref:flagellar hook-associated protein FlgK n=1 Tax=Rhizobium cremeum TaxID=2813827 RepID=UPI000DDF2673
MSLASALNTTKSIFSNTSTQTSVVSGNISSATTSDYNRRTAVTTTNAYTGATTVKVERTEDAALLKQVLQSISDDSGQQSLLAGLETLNSVMGGDEYSATPSEALTALREALQTYAASPSDATLAAAAVAAANDVATSLNQQTQAVQELRTDTDGDIATTVNTLNQLLSDFEKANNAVKSATASGGDANNALDTRESLLKQISEIIGISTTVRDNNDIAIYTTTGVTLFETVPREVSFDATPAYDANTVGNAVYIDGVALPAGEGSSTSAAGSLQALLQLRDEVYPGYQNQLDEIARGTMLLFSETDAGGAAIAGLFTTVDASVVDFETADIIPGLAGLITVSSAAQADPNTLRDGDIAGVDQNTEGAAGYSDLLYKYVAGFETQMAFDADADISTNATLLDFTSDSIGWVQEYRSDATTAAENTSAMLNRSEEAYSNATGVNLDEELILLLDIEQSYKAASKLLSTIDEMLASLMEAAS